MSLMDDAPIFKHIGCGMLVVLGVWVLMALAIIALVVGGAAWVWKVVLN